MDGKMNEWFELSYANYMVLPRTLIQEMPEEWQEKMYNLLIELENTFPKHHTKGYYQVKVRDEKGRFCKEPFGHYRNPNYEYINKVKA